MGSAEIVYRFLMTPENIVKIGIERKIFYELTKAHSTPLGERLSTRDIYTTHIVIVNRRPRNPG